ncbi:MAG: transcription-repair coupling factor [Peptococcaceae bacterium]|nr:transcription-repair coupling factor [Peptococcaceae bacterium]
MLLGTPPLADVPDLLQRDAGPLLVYGVGGEHQALVGAALAQDQRPLLIVTPGEKEASRIAEDLSILLPGRDVFVFLPWEILPSQVLAYSKHLSTKRLTTLQACLFNRAPVVVAPVEALPRRLVPPDCFRSSLIELTVGDTYDLGELRTRLGALGYEHVTQVEAVGEFSTRGGIVDIFPSTSEKPLRVEFWGDEITSLRVFDPETQRSEDRIEAGRKVFIGPAYEVVVSEDRWEPARRAIDKELQSQIKKLRRGGNGEAAETLETLFEEKLTHLSVHNYFPGIEELLPYFYPEAPNLFGYLPPDTTVVVAEPGRVAEVAERFEAQRAEGYGLLMEKGQILPGQYDVYLPYAAVMDQLKKHPLVYAAFLPRAAGFPKAARQVGVVAKGIASTLGSLTTLVNEIKNWRRRNYGIVLLVGTRERARRLVGNLRQNGVNAFHTAAIKKVSPGDVIVGVGTLSQGFEYPAASMVVFTENEIYGRKLYTRRHKVSKGKTLEELDLQIGDYIVHVSHGIGKFMGIVPLSIGGVQREYLLLKYAGDDKLYVPTDQLGLIQKFIGAEGETPRLSRLGGSDWSRTKKKVRQAVQEVAEELIKLYAARQSMPGYAFPPDTPWQAEFEAAFPFEETPDQLRAIAEIKADMEKPRPMDRLLCGDVGYGKTEVAMRAAFKAVMAGKQVAVLVPTTVLAQQHEQTFKERFQGFPVEIQSLSRFKTPREQKEILKGLARGTVDIVIGTHRLVSQDVKFYDLGLVVVDEEQRFGVVHKERLKLMCANVDVLTLTATPIPRTLYMSLIGIRDTSLLETPPQNRFPVQTYVLEEDPVIIQEAIRRELARGGQVYLVHNRVQELDRVVAWAQELVPEASIAMAHGQMREEDLERVMLDFVAGAYDILVCTTIIETGMDIPNVNTLIVKDADQLGLAQLYQLRGRVGRSNRLAYAYFTFTRDKILSEAAEKRLSAIRDFTDFGSGFKLAKRDLEIRGAGNLLGTEQHGNIAVVGFEMYCRLLEEAVREIKGEQPAEEEVDTLVELPVTAYLPDEYVPDAEQKVKLYRALAAVKNHEEVEDLAVELRDRFGNYPSPVQNLLAVARVRAMGRNLKIKAINRQGGYYRFVFMPRHTLTGNKLVKVAQAYSGRVRFKEKEDGFEIWLKAAQNTDNCDSVREIETFLAKIS